MWALGYECYFLIAIWVEKCQMAKSIFLDQFYDSRLNQYLNIFLIIRLKADLGKARPVGPPSTFFVAREYF